VPAVRGRGSDFRLSIKDFSKSSKKNENQLQESQEFKKVGATVNISWGEAAKTPHKYSTVFIPPGLVIVISYTY
jgi:hypothetical protein